MWCGLDCVDESGSLDYLWHFYKWGLSRKQVDADGLTRMQIRLPTIVEANEVGEVLIMDVCVETNSGKIENHALNLEPLFKFGLSYGAVETQSVKTFVNPPLRPLSISQYP